MRRRRRDVVLVGRRARWRHDDLADSVVVEEREPVRHEARKRFRHPRQLLRDVAGMTVAATGDDRRPEVHSEVNAVSPDGVLWIGKMIERRKWDGLRGLARVPESAEPLGVPNHR